jgi:hypothetical protein
MRSTGLCVGLLAVGASGLRVAAPTTPKAVAAPAIAASSSSWYQQLSERHYLPLACVQSGCLRGGSDVVAQMLRESPVVDLSHAGAMATVGVLISGLIGASWLRLLESQLGSGVEPADVAKKSLADYCLYAPFANSMYLLLVPALSALYSSAPDLLLCNGDICTADLLATAVGTASAAWTHGFGSAMTLEAMIFAPYNLMSFRMIPSAFRPQTTAAACAGYTIALSSLC